MNKYVKSLRRRTKEIEGIHKKSKSIMTFWFSLLYIFIGIIIVIGGFKNNSLWLATGGGFFVGYGLRSLIWER